MNYKTFNKWIKFEYGCEMPDDGERVIIPAPDTRSKLASAIFSNNKFYILERKGMIIEPSYFMRFDISWIKKEHNFKIMK